MHACTFTTCRGQDFRPEYRRLGTLRSLVKPTVCFIAMTATPSAQMKDIILKSLHMQKADVVEETPDKSNIFYGILKSMDIGELAKQLAMGIIRLGLTYSKTFVFCRRYVIILC